MLFLRCSLPKNIGLFGREVVNNGYLLRGSCPILNIKYSRLRYIDMLTEFFTNEGPV